MSLTSRTASPAAAIAALRAAGGDEIYALRAERPRLLHEPSLVGNGNERPADGHDVDGHVTNPSNSALRNTPRTRRETTISLTCDKTRCTGSAPYPLPP